MKRSKKKPKTISLATAITRIEEMLVLIEENVQIGISVEAALESANDIVMKEMRGVTFYGAECYNTVSQCLGLELALVLARLYDVGSKRRHPNERDVASIPLMIRLMRQKRCKDFLCHRARSWTPRIMENSNATACERAIDMAAATFSSLQKTPDGRKAVKTLKAFRDKKLAHSLIGTILKTLPRYNDLFLLMRVAREVTSHAKLAIRGSNHNFEEAARIRYDLSKAFWTPAFKAVANHSDR